jgi:hypothetical protein
MTVNQGYAREVKRWNKGEVNDWLSPYKSFPHSTHTKTKQRVGSDSSQGGASQHSKQLPSEGLVG